jgi:3-oxoacyl-[acyl-carrier-protein] synthase II
MTARPCRDVWITGVCLVSSVGDGPQEHWVRLSGACAPLLGEHRRTGWLVHPLPGMDFSSQIPSRLDLKRMGSLQALGAYAAGRALEAAGLKGSPEILSRSVVVVSGAGGERDLQLDESIFSEPTRFTDQVALNEMLSARTRPSFFLAQLPNLLAGNISILFGVTGGSRTTMGDELAGVSACKVGCQLVGDGSYDVALVGGSFDVQRPDLLMLYGFGEFAWRHGHQPVALRSQRGGGFMLGTMAAFLVLESAGHARARGASPWCRVDGISTHHSRRQKGDVARALQKAWEELELRPTTTTAGIISGATGVSPSTEEEMAALSALASGLGGARIRVPGTLFGHGMEASFPFNVGIAALALKQGHLFPGLPGDPLGGSGIGALNRLLVTSVGHWRGEAVALLSTADPQ